MLTASLKNMPIGRLGAVIGISVAGLMQFIDVDLGTINGIDVTVQKVCALAGFPIALALMGRIAIRRVFIWLFVCLLTGNWLWYVIQGDPFDKQLMSINITLAFAFIGTVTLYTALVARPEGIKFLIYVMVLGACISASICILQAFRLIPLYFVPADELQGRSIPLFGGLRATGLKFDPNFEALVLSVGGVCAGLLRNKCLRWGAVVLIFTGIICTWSRMGILILALALLCGVKLQSSRVEGASRVFLGRSSVVIVVLLIFTFVYLFALPSAIRGYVSDRVSSAYSGVECIVAGSCADMHTSSAETRAKLARASITAFTENPVFGTGVGREVQVLKRLTGFSNVSHDTYLQLAMSDGIMGVAAVAIWGVFLFRYGLRSNARMLDKLDDRQEAALARGLGIIFLVTGFLLSLNLNFMFWVPLAVVAACKRRAQWRKYASRHEKVIV